jgi:hypothetical protein
LIAAGQCGARYYRPPLDMLKPSRKPGTPFEP